MATKAQLERSIDALEATVEVYSRHLDKLYSVLAFDRTVVSTYQSQIDRLLKHIEESKTNGD